MPVTYLPAYTQNKTISLPEVRLYDTKPTYVYVPLRGYGALLAVYDTTTNAYAGWIDVRLLGYETARAWVEGTGWKDQGY